MIKYLILLGLLLVGCGRPERSTLKVVEVGRVEFVRCNIRIVSNYNNLSFLCGNSIVGEINEVKRLTKYQAYNGTLYVVYYDVYDRLITLYTTDLKEWRVYRIENPHSGTF